MYERVEALPQVFTDIRDEYLDKFADKNLDGLNTNRIHEYFDENELDVKPYIVVTPGDLKKVNKIDKKVGTLRGSFAKGSGTEGLYSPEMGMSIILRNPRLEAKNGPAYTEGHIVHEGAHSTAAIASYLRKKESHSYHNARSGFAFPLLARSSGFLFEEGWADLHRGNYLSKHFEDGSLDQVREAAEWGRGPNETVSIELGGRQTPLPFKYVKVEEDGRLTSFPSVLAAYTVELLVQANPDIYPAMRESRANLEDLRDFAQEVNSLRPGLYPALRRLDYNEEDFARGLHMTLDEVVSRSHFARN